MNKFERSEVAKALSYGNTLGQDYMARALSALHRAARTKKSKDAIFKIAVEVGVLFNPEFII